MGRFGDIQVMKTVCGMRINWVDYAMRESLSTPINEHIEERWEHTAYYPVMVQMGTNQWGWVQSTLQWALAYLPDGSPRF